MEHVRNAIFSTEDRAVITGDWLHPDHGWIPYTAVMGVSEVMDSVFKAFLTLPPAAYQPPPPPSVEEVHMMREMAYKEESDPLFMEWQYDMTDETNAIWMDRVRDIKLRYPLPT